MSVDLVLGTSSATGQPLNINDNGTLGTPITLPSATSTTAGLMSANDKSKIILQDGNSFAAPVQTGSADASNYYLIYHGQPMVAIRSNHVAFLAPLVNNTSINNARIDLSTTGTVISRNVADTNVALKINQQNAGSTGNILALQKSGTDQLTVSSSGVIKATNLAGTDSRMVTADSAGTLSANKIVDSGVFNPVITGANTYAAYGFKYSRVGDTVHVGGVVEVSSISVGGFSFSVSLPPSISSTFSNQYDVTGVVSGIALNLENYIAADTVNNEVVVKFTSTQTACVVYLEFDFIIQ